MKALDIAIKDLRQSFRSFFAIAFMFVLPILITGLFAFIFGGGSEESEISFEPIPVQVYNQDRGEFGEILLTIWGSDAFSDLIALTVAEDEAGARQAVDEKQAEVAILLPAEFTETVVNPGRYTGIELYQDPTLTLGPGIMKSLVTQFVDALNGSNITAMVANQQAGERGYTLTQEQNEALSLAYYSAVSASAQQGTLVNLESPGGEQQEENAGIKSILGFIMGGMMIFYAYFTGAYASNTILTEEENGTLERLFGTATAPHVIITGKLLAAALMIFVQLVVLTAFGRLVFGIQWGALGLLLVFVLVTTIGAASFGMFAISLAKDRKQAGVIMGAGITVTGMLGMSGTFMLSSPTPNAAIDRITLLVPQGWANRALLAIMEGLSPERIWLSILGLLVYSAVLVVLGFVRFQKRFA
ncbi:MAG: ABC transporter permease [Anaerolineales bacterium]|nr:ABC transporter permease [Anaerolineales bacterium]